MAGHPAPVCWSNFGDWTSSAVAETEVEQAPPRTDAISDPLGVLGNTDCANRAQALFDSRCRLTKVCRYGRLLVDEADGEAGVTAPVVDAAVLDLRSRLLWNEFHRRMGSRKYCLDLREAGRDSSGLDSFFSMPFLHFDDDDGLRLSAAAPGNRCCSSSCRWSSMRFSSCLECFFIVAVVLGTGVQQQHVRREFADDDRGARRRPKPGRGPTLTPRTIHHCRDDGGTARTGRLNPSPAAWCASCGGGVCGGHAHARWHVVRRCRCGQGRSRRCRPPTPMPQKSYSPFANSLARSLGVFRRTLPIPLVTHHRIHIIIAYTYDIIIWKNISARRTHTYLLLYTTCNPIIQCVSLIIYILFPILFPLVKNLF